MRKAFPLADKKDRKAQALICLRVCLFTVYTWFALAYVPPHNLTEWLVNGVSVRQYCSDRNPHQVSLTCLRPGVSNLTALNFAPLRTHH